MNQGGFAERAARGVLGSIDESQQIPGVEVAKAMHLVLDGYRVAERLQDQPFEIKAHVGPLGPDVKQEIAGRRGRSVHRSTNLGKAAQLRGALRPVESIPGIAPDPDVAGQTASQIPETHRAGETSDIADHLEHPTESSFRGVDRENQKHGGPRQGGHDALGLNRHAVGIICHRMDLAGTKGDT